MMRIVTPALLLVCLLPPAAVAVGDLDQLLRRAQQHSSATRATDAQREARFLNQRERQADGVAEARAELAALQRRSDQLQQQHQHNSARIDTLQTTLNQHSDELQQVFRSARRSASMLDGVLRESLVSAQYPQRRQGLQALLTDDAAAKLEDLQQLWTITLQEMVSAGRSERFVTEMIGADGRSERAQVTRIGVFSLVRDGNFLSLRDGRLYQLPRQPEASIQAQAAAFERAADGLADAVLDPSRGAWLELLVHRPSLLDRVRQGGLIGYLIIALGGLGLLLGLWRLAAVWITARRVQRQLDRADHPEPHNPLGRVLLAWQRLQHQQPQHLELQLQEAALREMPALTRTQSLLKLLAAVAPLLGLLGTVTGMILTFQAITLSGAANTQLMANGIGQALVTTVLGLVAAIPLLLVHNLLATRSRAVIQVLDQETAGLIASALSPAPEPAPATAAATA